MWSYICPELIKAIEAEPETDVLSEHFNSLARCIEILGVGCLNDQQMGDLVKIMIKAFTVSMISVLPVLLQTLNNTRGIYLLECSLFC